MRRFRRARADRTFRWLRWPVLILAVLYLALRITEAALFEPLEAIAQIEAHRIAAETLNRVVTERVGQALKPELLVQYEKDQDGRIAAYRVNTALVNQVSADAARAVQHEMGRLAEQPLKLPLGALTGSTLLAGLGPRVGVKLVPAGSVAIDIKQEFQGGGINQSQHRIWLEATAAVRIILPLTVREVVVTQELPLSETVIVGPVPGSFYGGNIGGYSLPLGR